MTHRRVKKNKIYIKINSPIGILAHYIILTTGRIFIYIYNLYRFRIHTLWFVYAMEKGNVCIIILNLYKNKTKYKIFKLLLLQFIVCTVIYFYISEIIVN